VIDDETVLPAPELRVIGPALAVQHPNGPMFHRTGAERHTNGLGLVHGGNGVAA